MSIAAFLKPALFQLLAVLVAVLATLGVLNSVLMATRERVHDLGIYKAVGMTPRQAIAMVISSVISPAIIAAIIAAVLAVPAGLILQDTITHHQAAKAGFVLPVSFVHVLGAADLTLLALAGLAIAAIGALGPPPGLPDPKPSLPCAPNSHISILGPEPGDPGKSPRTADLARQVADTADYKA